MANISHRHLSVLLRLWLVLLLAFAGSPAAAHINGIAKVDSLNSSTSSNPVYTPANVSTTTPVVIKATVTDSVTSVNQSITLTVNDTLVASDTVTYYHNDALGSPIAATDAAGALLWRETYRPYGERLDNPAAAATNPIWFTGKRQDPETGLVYMGARYYNPALGRFLGIDPVEPDENNLHSLNRYAYANNNPYKFTDPDGQVAESVIDVISLGLSIKTFRQDPGFINGLAVAYDGLATAVPFLPGGIGIIRQAATKGSDVTQAVKQAADRGAAKAGSELADPKTIRFTQDSIRGSFKDGRSVNGLAEDLKAGRVSSNEIPAIRTFDHKGQTYTLDNRRLKAFQDAGVSVRTRPASAQELKKELPSKFTTKNDGQSIRVRGDGS